MRISMPPLSEIASLPSLDLTRRLEDILKSITLIEDYVAKAGGADMLLRVEDELHDAVERRLLIISEAAVKLGTRVEIHEPAIPWKDIRGLGNSLRHNYDGVNNEVIKEILDKDLIPLAQACERLKVAFAADTPIKS